MSSDKWDVVETEPVEGDIESVGYAVRLKLSAEEAERLDWIAETLGTTPTEALRRALEAYAAETKREAARSFARQLRMSSFHSARTRSHQAP